MSNPLTTAAEEFTERDEYRTPPEIFDGLGGRFDLDVAAPIPFDGPYCVPASRRLTIEDDGLSQPWEKHHRQIVRPAFVWMNPPFGKRNGVVPWLKRFFEHGHGIGLVGALTSAGWFHDWMPRASGLFFPRGKTRFIRRRYQSAYDCQMAGHDSSRQYQQSSVRFLGSASYFL